MARESDLLDPLVDWLVERYDAGGKLLVHEEPQGRGGTRPDILVVFSEDSRATLDKVALIAIEIECSSKASIHYRKTAFNSSGSITGIRSCSLFPAPSRSARRLMKSPSGARVLALGSWWSSSPLDMWRVRSNRGGRRRSAD